MSKKIYLDGYPLGLLAIEAGIGMRSSPYESSPSSHLHIKVSKHTQTHKQTNASRGIYNLLFVVIIVVKIIKFSSCIFIVTLNCVMLIIL